MSGLQFFVVVVGGGGGEVFFWEGGGGLHNFKLQTFNKIKQKILLNPTHIKKNFGRLI